MPRPVVIANWKMHTNAADAHILAMTVRNAVCSMEGVDIVLCPPMIWLSEVASVLGKGRISLGAQNMFYEPEGAYTGEVSPSMIKDLASHVIIGHSERREHFGETDFDVNEKVIAALKTGLIPIICVGERKKSLKYPEEPVNQLKQSLLHVPVKYLKNIIVAYEPVWAIGTGLEAPPEYAAKVITELRAIVRTETPILYGGSVNSKNTANFVARPEIDGLLVGGASLRSAEFIKICQIWQQGKSFKAK